jgi:nitroreductase
MELIDVLRSTGAVRAFTDAAVDDATVAAILDDARFAPSGGNRQPWRVAVVRDRNVRLRLARLMQTTWDDYNAQRNAGLTPFAVGNPPRREPSTHTPNSLLENIESVPVVLAVAADLGSIALMDAELDRPALTGGASIYPFCWSILLAARARGLGGVLTTFLSHQEPVASGVLGLPHNHALAATIFLGVPEQQPTRLRRQPPSTFTTVDRFDGPSFSVES